MRFLIISLGFHPDVVGGAWRVAAAQAAGLARRGHSVQVITAQSDRPGPAHESRDGFILHRFPQSSGHFFSNWRNENRAAEELLHTLATPPPTGPHPPTVIIQHHSYLGPATARVPERIPILHVFHGPWAHEYRLAQTARPRGLARRFLDLAIARTLHVVEARSLRRARRIITLSRHFAERLPVWHPGGLPPIQVAHGGVDLEQFVSLAEAERLAIRQSYGLSPDETLFVALRRLDPRMGLNVLIDAFARVVTRHPGARLWLTGRGPAEDALREQIQRHRLESTVRLLGFVPESELPRLLNAADAAVMPSLDLEGFGLATAEALACGTPVLGSRAGATPELLEPLDPGLLFPPASLDGLALRLEDALRHPGGLPARDRCAEYARARFSWETQITACERGGLELNAHPLPLAA